MNEFIVWDKALKRWCDNVTIRTSGLVCSSHPEHYEVLEFIGKTDDTPEKNKIYADRSVVEFELGGIINMGYFTFDRVALRYVVVILTDLVNHPIYYTDFIHNIKVIGTLQENPKLFKKKYTEDTV